MAPIEDALREAAYRTYAALLMLTSRTLGVLQTIDATADWAGRSRGAVLKELARTGAWYEPAAAPQMQRMIDMIEKEEKIRADDGD